MVCSVSGGAGLEGPGVGWGGRGGAVAEEVEVCSVGGVGAGAAVVSWRRRFNSGARGDCPAELKVAG